MHASALPRRRASSKLCRGALALTVVRWTHFEITVIVQLRPEAVVGKSSINSPASWGPTKRAATVMGWNVPQRTCLRAQPQYDDDAYWDDRYREESSPYEWVRDYSELRHIIENATRGNRSCRILNVGCGSSTLPEDLYDDGYCRISNIDLSAVVVEKMMSRSKNRSMWWYKMDATQMAFVQDSFDLVIDKSLLDTLLCAKRRDWIVQKYLAEVRRVLAPGGNFMCVSFGRPSDRLTVLEPHLPNFSMDVIKLPPTNAAELDNVIVDVVTVLGHYSEYRASLAAVTENSNTTHPADADGSFNTADAATFQSNAMLGRAVCSNTYVYLGTEQVSA